LELPAERLEVLEFDDEDVDELPPSRKRRPKNEVSSPRAEPELEASAINKSPAVKGARTGFVVPPSIADLLAGLPSTSSRPLERVPMAVDRIRSQNETTR
jgi:hypothetical protein